MSTLTESRAYTFTAGYPDSFKLSKISLPKTPADNHILVEIAACALNPVDIQKMNMPKWKYPSFLGGDLREKGTVMDFSGTVIASGARDQFSQGDEIFGMALMSQVPAGGSLAEVAHFNLATTPCVQKPANWSFEKAAGISLVWLTAKQCIDAVTPWVEKSEGKRLAVLGGSSSTGMYTILLAKQKGWTVAATSSGKNKEFVIEKLKADAHIDYTSQDVRKGVTAFKPDAVVDCVGGTECIGIPSSKRYITIVGDKTGRTNMGGPYTYYDIWHPYNAAAQWLRWARGNFGMGESYDITILSPKKQYLEDAKGMLTPDEVYIDSVHAFEDAKQAFERLNTGRATGKVVVKVQK